MMKHRPWGCHLATVLAYPSTSARHSIRWSWDGKSDDDDDDDDDPPPPPTDAAAGHAPEDSLPLLPLLLALPALLRLPAPLLLPQPAAPALSASPEEPSLPLRSRCCW